MVIPAIIALALFAAAYSLYGGLSAVAWTDVIQVALLVIGGIITTLVALHYVTPDGGIMNGISHVANVAGDKFDMILSRDHKEYNNLPGIYVLIGGLWVANLYYWGFNQYIIQRTLAARSLKEAQRGIAFAAFLKMLIPFIVAIPGIIAWVMFTENLHGAKSAFEIAGSSTLNNDNAYPWLISTFIPIGIKGLVLAALAAAIVSSLASMLKLHLHHLHHGYLQTLSQSKRFPTSIGEYRPFDCRHCPCHSRITGTATGRHRPNVPVHSGIYRLGEPGNPGSIPHGTLLEKATNKGAIWGVLCSIPIALIFKLLPFEMPFMDQMFYTCILTIVIIFMVSLSSCPTDDDPKAIKLTADMFKTDKVFNICAYIICILLAIITLFFF